MQNKESLRILIITYQGGIAGSTMSVSYLCRGLSNKGHKAILACTKESMYKDLLADTDVEVIHLPFTGKTDRTSMRMIRDIVLREKIQIINAQASKDRYLTIFARWLYKLPVKLIHTRRQVPLSVGGLQSWFYTKGTDRIVAVSKGIKDALAKKGIPQKHISVIYNGTPTEKYKAINATHVEAIKKKFNLKPSDVVLGCVSRLKKQEQLIEALKHIETPLTVFFIGITKEQLQERIDTNCPQHKIHFLGTIDARETLHYYKIFDLNVLPSISEGLSQALLEAMFLGVAVIATDAAGNPDLIQHNENGLLFKDGDIEGLKNAIHSIISDEKLSKRLAENGKKTAHENFSINKTIENYEQFFYDLLEK